MCLVYMINRHCVKQPYKLYERICRYRYGYIAIIYVMLISNRHSVIILVSIDANGFDSLFCPKKKYFDERRIEYKYLRHIYNHLYYICLNKGIFYYHTTVTEYFVTISSTKFGL